MQLTGGARRILTAGEAVVFDTAINDQSPDISYSPMSGEFVLSRPGSYYISWWVATDGSEFSTDIGFAVRVNGADYALGAAPVVTGQLGGSALVTVGAAPAVLTLNQTLPLRVALAATPVQANIVILQVS